MCYSGQGIFNMFERVDLCGTTGPWLIALVAKSWFLVLLRAELSLVSGTEVTSSASDWLCKGFLS